ncbi:hypothetical protein ASPWEDRAFT_173765 [Aspergillus wentii DTO 134E9]|uniref:Uncharacterized protein n=1 Tax=Aspergillus wentii DTO 134E9 TaxID=1073089 RepID=A0A1L9RHL9_ASPWE|nr:uncharacterized protein ASPWEDRAFT_173765 [Aspergillus wentii DTO 134E9]KAI9925682.1 hypothetical protein MW887_005484 [Aspergillus wentii]OJJ34347.1 hypothetical protein ASPWEDRAFT_173765 [Aspergillus wentii DTO 134E9]
MDLVSLSQPTLSHSSTSASTQRPSLNPFRNNTSNGAATNAQMEMTPRILEEQPASRESYNRFGLGMFGDRAERRERLTGRRHASSSTDPEPSQYRPNGRYVPIDLQPISTQNRWGDQGPSDSASPQESTRSPQYERHDGVWVRGSRGRNGQARSCAALLKEKKARRKLFTLITSTLFLILVLSVYIAFTFSHAKLGQELHILLIFMILILAIVFCHSLIRFFMVTMRRRNAALRNRVPSRAGPAGYAQPTSPIHVVLAGDEEASAESHGIIREKVTAPPPAYGLWRSSVRMNPDLLYWQRVDGMSSHKSNPFQRSLSRKTTLPRPPSYTSDDGIDYVVDAQPRSFAPNRTSQHE